MQENNSNILKQKIQREALETLCTSKNLIVNWGTGVGKSRVFIRAVNNMERRGYSKFLLLVAESAHKINWQCEFVKALGDERGNELFKMITVECYASLKKYENSEWDFICADEAHHLRSNLRMSLLSTLKSKYVLCLSATFSDKGDADQLLRVLRETFGPFAWTKYELQNAINDGLLPEPAIYIHVLKTDAVQKDKVVEISWGVPWYRKKVKVTADQFREQMETLLNTTKFPNMQITVTECTEQQELLLMNKCVKIRKEIYKSAYGHLLKLMENGANTSAINEASKNAEFFKNQMLQAGAARKRFYGHCKTEYAHQLLESMGDKRYICFCTDIEQVEELGGQNIIHSQKKNNAEVIKTFNAGDINSIFAVGMIKEGQNLNGINAGIVVQLGGKERDFIQQFGRAMRSDSPEQHIIVVNSDKDYEYLNNALENINKQYIKTIYA